VAAWQGVFAVISIGCGRIAFDPLGGETFTQVDAAQVDAAGAACPLSATVPDPLSVSGRTVQVSALGQFSDEPSVVVSILAPDGSLLGMTTSSSTNGDFTLSVSTGGKPMAFVTTLEKATLLTTWIVPDQPISSHVMYGSTSPFLGSSSGNSVLYSIGSTGYDNARGTVLVHVRDCSGQSIEGATISFTPGAEKIVYSNSLGAPSASETVTGITGRAWGLNVPPGPVQITANKSGMTFTTHEIVVVAGDNFMSTPARPFP
jgi:hypothetical protein